MIIITHKNRLLNFAKEPKLTYSTNPNKLYFKFKVGAFDCKKSREFTKLFEKTFYAEIHESQIFQFIKDFDEMSVEELFRERMSDHLLQAIQDKAEKYVSSDIPEPVLYEKGEFIEVDSETNFHGNCKYLGKEGCLMYGSWNEASKEQFLILSGTDDSYYGEVFYSKETFEKEKDRLRKIQPINLETDLLNYGYVAI